MMEKWKSDPGIQFVCYYLQPQVSHCAVFQVDSVSKIDEMDTDINTARQGGWLLAQCSIDTVFGESRADEWWAT
jgi:hypothetical protein